MHGSHGHDKKPHASQHDKHAGHSPEMFRDRFWISLLLTVPVVFWSPHIEELLGYQAPRFPGSDWIPSSIGTAVFGYGGLIFLRSALGELRTWRPGMMTLISLAISVAFVFSWVVALGGIKADALWWELATLVTVMLLGHWIEMRSIRNAQGALKELAKLLPDEATRLADRSKRLVLRARAHPPVARQMGEKIAQRDHAKLARMPSIMKAHISPHPRDVHLGGAGTVVKRAEPVAQDLDQRGTRGHDRNVGRRRHGGRTLLPQSAPRNRSPPRGQAYCLATSPAPPTVKFRGAAIRTRRATCPGP